MKLRTLLLMLAVTGLSATQLFPQASFNTLKMDSLLDVYYQKNKMMVSLAVSEKGNTVYKKTTGYAWNQEGKQLMANSETKYRIGSISKTFTAVMILQLIEEKKVKLSTPLSKFFPKFLNAKKITVEQLLRHRSGIHDFTGDVAYEVYHHYPKTQEELMDLFMKLPSDFEPDAKYTYCNTNYVLLGWIVEKLTKKTYTEALNERIINKIGLKNTYYGAASDITRNEARSFTFTGTQWEALDETDMSIPGGAGALVSTAEDLTDMVEAIFDYRLLKKETVDQMITMKEGYGLGMISVPFEDKISLGHFGRIDNFESAMVYFQNERLAMGLSTNGKNTDVNAFMIGVLSICFNKNFTIPQFYTFDVSQEVLNEYQGKYYSTMLQLEFYILKEGNVITAQAAGQSKFPLDARDESTFIYDAAHIEIVFKRDGSNKVNELILKQNGIDFVFNKLND